MMTTARSVCALVLVVMCGAAFAQDVPPLYGDTTGYLVTALGPLGGTVGTVLRTTTQDWRCSQPSLPPPQEWPVLNAVELAMDDLDHPGLSCVLRIETWRRSLPNGTYTAYVTALNGAVPAGSVAATPTFVVQGVDVPPPPPPVILPPPPPPPVEPPPPLQPGSSVWYSWDVVTQAGAPQGRVTSSTGLVATMEFYESTNNGGVQKGALLGAFFPNRHPADTNMVDQYWAPNTGGPFGSGDVYPYVGKHTVRRGSDVGETNVPPPLGVRDLQLQPPNNPHSIVAAFIVPVDGNYTLTNVAAHHLWNTGGPSVLRVFGPDASLLTTVTATSNRAWVLSSANGYALPNLTAGQSISFAVGDAFAYDQTQIAWTITREAPVTPPPPPPVPSCTLSANPETPTFGQPVTLSWTSVDATSIGLDNGGGLGRPPAGTVSLAVPPPVGTTTYTATATGAGGSATCTATVIVAAPPPPPPPAPTPRPPLCADDANGLPAPVGAFEVGGYTVRWCVEPH